MILDEYQSITSLAIHEILGYLLEHMPPRMHLVILTRADPPLPLARLRARNQLTEIRAEHLRFTADEVATFIRLISGINLSLEDIAVLESRSEGWAAGLQLAALSLQDASDPHALVSDLHGDNRHIADYLLQGVLRHQSLEVQKFLM